MKRNGFKLVLSSLFAAMIAMGAVFSLPLPPPLPPITLAVFFSLLSGLLLGPRWALATTGLYLGLGAVGLPVFANGAGGLGQLAGPTGGFLVGYVAAAVVAGAVSDRRRWGFGRAVAGALAGVAALYIVGLPRFRAVLDAGPDRSVTMGAAFLMMAPYLVGDMAKALAAAGLVRAMRPLLAEYLPARDRARGRGEVVPGPGGPNDEARA
ncbi:MAG TPA: biotin transporter BioY [Spirochaetales bacterium]|nr:biotin transporter BioY [Spirochaetales bacterium]